jgi:hypothetical protein
MGQEKDPMTRSDEPREVFHLPITLTVGDKQIEVPLVVSLTFPQLAAIVRDHLSQGTDVYGALLEHYAESVGARPRAPKSRAATPDANGPRTPRRRKAPAGVDSP